MERVRLGPESHYGYVTYRPLTTWLTFLEFGREFQLACEGWRVLQSSSPGKGFRFGTRSSTFVNAPFLALFARAAI